MKRVIIVVLTLILTLLVATTGCGTKTTTTTATTTPTAPSEPSYASEMAENILMAINEEDYAKFRRDFDQAMKGALTEAAFPDLFSYVKSKAGDYVSKQYYTTVVEGEYTAVVYIAKYTNRDNVSVTVSFSTVEGKNLISGLHFPNLQ